MNHEVTTLEEQKCTISDECNESEKLQLPSEEEFLKMLECDIVISNSQQNTIMGGYAVYHKYSRAC